MYRSLAALENCIAWGDGSSHGLRNVVITSMSYCFELWILTPICHIGGDSVMKCLITVSNVQGQHSKEQQLALRGRLGYPLTC